MTKEELKALENLRLAKALAQSEEANAALRAELEQARETIGELAVSEATLTRYNHFYMETSKALQSRLDEATVLLLKHSNNVALLADALFRTCACMVGPEAKDFNAKVYAALADQQLVNAFLKPPSGVSGAGGSDV